MKNKKQQDEFFKMIAVWLREDTHKAGYIWNYIEKRNEAYSRGHRAALHSVLRKAEEVFKENYLL